MIQSSYFKNLGHSLNIKVFDYLDEYTTNTKHLRLPCLVAATVSLVVSVASRTAAIGEDILRSSLYLIQAPLQENRSEYLSKSFKIIKRIPSEIAYTLTYPLAYLLINLPTCILEPKLFVVEGIEKSAIFKKYLSLNSINSDQYWEEIRCLAGRSEIGLRAWQEAESEDGIIREINRFTEEHGSRWVLKNLNKQRL